MRNANHTTFLTVHGHCIYPRTLYPQIHSDLESFTVKDHLTFIPAFAVAATVKQSSAFAFATKIHRSAASIFHRAQTDLQLVPQIFLKRLNDFGNMLKTRAPLNIREGRILCHTCTADKNKTPFLKDIRFSFVCYDSSVCMCEYLMIHC